MFPNDSGNVIFPKPIERKRPCEAVHLAASAKAALIPYPSDGVETAPHGLFEERITTCYPAEKLRPWVHANDVTESFNQFFRISTESFGDPIGSRRDRQFLKDTLQGPLDCSAQDRIARQIGKP
jgi:hypothetical protein